jgi:hypothetical protein
LCIGSGFGDASAAARGASIRSIAQAFGIINSKNRA